MSGKSKSYFGRYFEKLKNDEHPVSNDFLDHCISLHNKKIEEDEICQSLTKEYDFYYYLLKQSLDQEELQILIEIEEIVNQKNCVIIDKSYREGFKEP
ncbi:MAG: hypothetical protein LBS55_04380 [Prevotellaceae bacterium]|jgi:hypothetical protein|nr:hypothetical protein [Prevotellaceae bacterium]